MGNFNVKFKMKSITQDYLIKFWELIDEIRIRYISSLTRDEAAKIIEASDGCITHPENDDIDWSTDEFINDWNALHRGEEAIAR